jgi:hypothetical protein
VPWLEIAFGVQALVASLLSIGLALHCNAVFQGLFAAGLLWVGTGSLVEGRQARRTLGVPAPAA